jgi:hypothetical protein
MALGQLMSLLLSRIQQGIHNLCYPAAVAATNIGEGSTVKIVKLQRLQYPSSALGGPVACSWSNTCAMCAESSCCGDSLAGLYIH